MPGGLSVTGRKQNTTHSVRAALYCNCSIYKECQGWLIGDVRSKMGEIKWAQRAAKWGGNCTSPECKDNTGNVDLAQRCVELEVRALCPLVSKSTPGIVLPFLAQRSERSASTTLLNLLRKTPLLLQEIAQRKVNSAASQMHFSGSELPRLLNEENGSPLDTKAGKTCKWFCMKGLDRHNVSRRDGKRAAWGTTLQPWAWGHVWAYPSPSSPYQPLRCCPRWASLGLLGSHDILEERGRVWAFWHLADARCQLPSWTSARPEPAPRQPESSSGCQLSTVASHNWTPLSAERLLILNSIQVCLFYSQLLFSLLYPHGTLGGSSDGL